MPQTKKPSANYQPDGTLDAEVIGDDLENEDDD
jgi:hypothetical protein